MPTSLRSSRESQTTFMKFLEAAKNFEKLAEVRKNFAKFLKFANNLNEVCGTCKQLL